MKHIKCISLWAACLALAAWPQLGHAFSLAAQESIDFHANGLASDSFDSGDPNYSTNGLYHPLKRKAGGDILAGHSLTNSTLSIGNVHIAGKIRTGTFGNYTIGPSGSVGDLPWVDANTLGIQPGWATNMDIPFANVTLPSAIWLPTGPLNSVMGGQGFAPDGNFYDHVFLISGDFQVVDNGTIYVGTNTHVRVRSTIATYQPTKIYVAGTGANAGQLTTYLTGTTAVLGSNHVTQSGKAENLVFLGLPSLTSLSYNGLDDFTGVIYAPQANFQLNPNGSGVLDVVGCIVAKSVNLYGHYHFHFDENLKRIPSFANPTFPYQPQNRTVVAGENTTFVVFAYSTLPLTYQWNFLPLGGGPITPIPNATNSTITITNVTAETQGYYSIVVSNVLNTASSSNALLTVLSPAPVLQQPSSSASSPIQFEVVGIAGSNYVVLATTNLVDWSPQFTNVSPFTFVETNLDIPARFYRAVYLP